MNRRKFCGALTAAPLTAAQLTAGLLAKESVVPHQATGTRVGEITPTSAVVWTRLTLDRTRNMSGVVIPGRMDDYKGSALPQPTVPAEELEGACQPTGRAGTNTVWRGGEPSQWASNPTDKRQ